MATRQLVVQRFSVTSPKAFHDAVTAFQAAIGHPDMSSFSQNIAAAKTFSEVERIVQGGIGPSGLMEFARMDLGAVLRKKNATAAPNSMRFIVGNPVIMSRMLQQVPDAGSYAPVTVLIDEREDGTYFSYDRMASFLDVYGNPEALKVARELDAKGEDLLTSAAR